MTAFAVAIGGIILAIALVIGWIVLIATGHKVDTEYVGIVALAVGHAIGTNTGVNVANKP